ncbi:WASH complex subunit 2C isoform X3 [Lacerta agilis]|uniref:WASH complex subunit 2C isoform X3 n=1 Tax=Lacerta agilis TaxID=80427 RepID=UPI0014191BE7|nr:WASH complex subunit 2C isoform X3 [Lacerta agilis]
MSSAASPPASSSSSSSSGAAAAAAAAPPGATAAAAAALLLWERAWSLEEVRAGSPCWSLAADAGLLRFLQEFSQQTISRTHEIKKQMDRLIHETKSVDCRLHNVFNGFLMLSNTQFIENRVYDDEVEETISKSEVSDKPEQEKTREQKEADLIPKIQEAVNYGLQVLDSAFEQLDIKAGNSDSEEETNERIELILEPKDLYIDRPLPYLIGSQLFMEQDDVGLGDLSSEEDSVDSDRGSMIDSEGKDEEDLEEFENASEEDHKPRTALMSDEDDFFGDSEKGEDDDEEGDLEENARLKKKRPTSFTDELAARIKGEEEEQSYTKNKTTVTNKEESVSSDDDGDIFKPPKLTDEDFSPFCSKDGLFSGGTGLFDDEESDLFSELPKGEDVMEKESRVPINDGGNDVFSPSSFLKGKEDKKLAEPVTDKAPRHEDVGLFDDDDDDDDGGKLESNKKNFISAKPAADLFEGEEDLFQEKPDITNVINKAAKENKDFTAGDKSQPSAENVGTSTQTFSKGHKSLFSDEEDSEDLFSYPPKSKSSSSSKVTTKTSLSLFEDEDEEGLFGSIPKAQISKPPVKKATSLLFSSDEEDHWNIGQEVKPASESSQKKEPTKSASAASHIVKTSLFEEEGEEDLFVITKDSQRKPPKSVLLFQEDAVNGDSFFSIQQSHLPSGVQEVTQEDLLGTRQKKLVVETAGPLGEPGTLHGSDLGGGDAGEQQRKDEPLLEKDVKKRIKSVFSLFDEEEKNDAVDADKMSQREIEKPSENSIPSKSTGVFQDEELLFSHKLQKDNDPDVDIFARNKKEVPKPRIKLPSEGGLFDDGDDGLFSPSKAKPLVAEKKTVISSLEEDSEVLESNKNAKREESNLKAAEKSTGLGASKHRESSSRIGKLQASLDINPAVLLPSAKPPSLYPKTPIHEPRGIQHVETASALGSNKEMGVSFDDPMQADTLQNANKGRIKVTGKRRPPTRSARRLAAQGDNTNDTNVAEDPSPPLLKESSVPPATLHPSTAKLHRKESTEGSQSPLPTNSSEQLHEAAVSPGSKSAAQPNVHDLFESNDIFADSIAPKVTTRPKAKVETESLMSQVPKGGESLPVPLALDGANSEGLFQAEKPSKKPDPTPFLEDEDDLFATSKKTVKRKDPKPIPQLVQDPSVPDIFEDDIFASEALKPPVKAKSKELEANLFDDDVDIFADLAVKPKERSAKKKMESKSIFDEEIDDIFSPSSQSKTTIKKAQSFQAASGTKSEIRASSTFEDPLNVFEGQ